MRRFVLFALGSALTLTACATSPKMAQVLPGRTAQEAAAAFLDAFNALDSVRFEPFFAEDVTMFFPAGPFPKERVVGKPAVTAAFARFFAMARERGATRLNIEPLDMVVQDYGTFAVVSFHLKGNGNIGRRSLVFRRLARGWQIVQFHASSLEEDK